MKLEKSCDLITWEHDRNTLKILEAILQRSAFNCFSLKQLMDDVVGLNPWAFFFDLNLILKENSFKEMRELKTRFPYCPVFITAEVLIPQAVEQALYYGADDFICKPITAHELEVRFHIRKNVLIKKYMTEFQEIGDIVVHLSHRVATGVHGQCYFSPTEISILECLLRAQGELVERETLKEVCWGQVFISNNALNRKLYEVRRALKGISSRVVIQTVYGKGFCLKATAGI